MTHLSKKKPSLNRFIMTVYLKYQNSLLLPLLESFQNVAKYKYVSVLMTDNSQSDTICLNKNRFFRKSYNYVQFDKYSFSLDFAVVFNSTFIYSDNLSINNSYFLSYVNSAQSSQLEINDVIYCETSVSLFGIILEKDGIGYITTKQYD